MKIQVVLLFVITLLSFSTYAQVTLKFFSYVNPANGQKVAMWDMFPKEKRYHVAIRVNGYWYQILPEHGFLQTKELPAFSETFKRNGKTYVSFVETFIHPDLVLPDPDINKLRHLKFDIMASWDDPFKSQCSILVGKIIGIEPMKPRHTGLEGFFYPVKKSLSPDDIHNVILNWEGWINENDLNKPRSCKSVTSRSS